MMDVSVVRRVDRLLEERYGPKRWGGPREPLGVLIAAMLSQSTTDVNSRAAFDSLITRFPSWEQLAAVPVRRIAAAIRAGGLSNQKARRIKQLLRRLQRERGVASLDFLRAMTLQEAREYLLSFSGVGPKTAACVLLFGLGREAFPVDTHVLRVARRLGWLPEGTSAAEAHGLLEQLIPPELRYQLHLNLIAHGRALCRPRRPRCEDCPLALVCAWYLAGSPVARNGREG